MVIPHIQDTHSYIDVNVHVPYWHTQIERFQIPTWDKSLFINSSGYNIEYLNFNTMRSVISKT